MAELTFFFNDTATTEIYPLSLHDALPISCPSRPWARARAPMPSSPVCRRSEEHTSELQSQSNLVCRLLLEKKNRTPLSQRGIVQIDQRTNTVNITDLP